MTKRHEKPARVLVIINQETPDPKEKARILERLEGDELTYDLGVETAYAGISFGEWPYRCVRAKEFKSGFFLAATLVARDDLMVREDAIINKAIN